jgi:hypothetical protein
MENPALILVFLLIDRVGRKPLLAGGFFVASLCLLSNTLLPRGFSTFLFHCYIHFLVLFNRIRIFRAVNRKFIQHPSIHGPDQVNRAAIPQTEREMQEIPSHDKEAID